MMEKEHGSNQIRLGKLFCEIRHDIVRQIVPKACSQGQVPPTNINPEKKPVRQRNRTGGIRPHAGQKEHLSTRFVT